MAIVALVMLRFGIGYHFASEGISKIRSGNFSSLPFLSSAKGPFAGMFRGLVPDVDGKQRLGYARDEQGRPIIDLEPTEDAWNDFRLKVENHYGFDDRQKREAQRRQKFRVGQLKWYFDANGAAVIEYFYGLDRQARQEADPSFREVESLAGQGKKLNAELSGAPRQWLYQLGRLWDAYERDLLNIVKSEQLKRGELRMSRFGDGGLTTSFVDWFIPRFDATIGVLLIVGLFTRIASVAGAVFLASVVLSQWPGSPGAQSIYPQAIEGLALLVLAAVGAGRYAGLDSISYYVWARWRAPSPGNVENESNA